MGCTSGGPHRLFRTGPRAGYDGFANVSSVCHGPSGMSVSTTNPASVPQRIKSSAAYMRDVPFAMHVKYSDVA